MGGRRSDAPHATPTAVDPAAQRPLGARQHTTEEHAGVCGGAVGSTAVRSGDVTRLCCDGRGSPEQIASTSSSEQIASTSVHQRTANTV